MTRTGGEEVCECAVVVEEGRGMGWDGGCNRKRKWDVINQS